ncbi:uncharacterized protein LOC115086299 isoform X2 [Rhinatrema bivittatum]|uniref:uncharacterized protein LOC115086299 isoform X2 n=1 Tax=Rhinatrema bivittatum TaxID=194408 RepID=UPI00112B1AB8|nr:uncharacterized protein LOC115086299 isoform X2 [Rhinatrema bivittatum]
MRAELSKLTQRCAVYGPSIVWQQVKETELSEGPFYQSIRTNLADKEEAKELCYEESSGKEADPIDDSLLSTIDIAAHTMVLRSTIDRSSVFEINAAEKLNYFLSANEFSRRANIVRVPSSIRQNAAITNRGKRTGPCSSSAQKHQSTRPSKLPIKTSSLDKVREYMDQSNHVQFMIGQFETQFDHCKPLTDKERDDIAKRACVKAMGLQIEKRVREEFYNQKDMISHVTKETDVGCKSQYQISFQESSFRADDNYSSRRQIPCDSAYKGKGKLLSPPHLLQDVMSRETHHNLGMYGLPDILEAYKNSHNSIYAASQSIIQGLGKSSLQMSTSSIALEEENKETFAPLHRISSQISTKHLENKSIHVQRLQESAMNYISPSQRPSKREDITTWVRTRIVMVVRKSAVCDVGFSATRKILNDDMVWIPEGTCSCTFCLSQKLYIHSESPDSAKVSTSISCPVLTPTTHWKKRSPEWWQKIRQ